MKENSTFTKVNGIDFRFPDKEVGFILAGWLNGKSKVEIKGNFINSFCGFFLNKDIPQFGENEIAILLYDFRLSEVAEEMKNISSFKLALRVFKKVEESKFEEIFSIDTLYRMTSSIDLTKKLLKSVNEHLCEVAIEIKKNEHFRAENRLSYSFEELQILDSLEKMKIPIFMADQYKKGIYRDFNQFKNNSPDTTTVYRDSVHLEKIRVMVWNEEKGKNVELDNKTVYAVYDGNFLYKATNMGFYEMKREGFDFYFFGQTASKFSMRRSEKQPVIVTRGNDVGIGVVGVAQALFTDPPPLLNNFKINYRTGNPIQVDKDE